MPMEHIQADTFEMPKAKDGQQYLFVFVDSFSRFNWYYPSVNKGALDVARAFLNFMGMC